MPIELCHTLRTPPGTPHIVELAVDGQLVRVVVSPLGCVDPERELAIWRELLDTAALCVHPGEQLRQMDPAVLAIRLNTATLVINTGHPRAAIRVAMKLLHPGALVPFPVAWLLDQARTRPGRAAAASAAVVVGAATALTMTLVSFTAAPQPSSDLPVVAAAPTDDRPLTNNAPTPTPADPADGPAPDQDSPDPLDSAPPTKEQERSEDNDDAPGSPEPTARPAEPSPPPPGPTPLTPRSSSPANQPTSAALPPAQTSAPAPTPPTPEPASSPPPDPICHVLDIELGLPILDVGVCV
ncbi:hypothetical protein ABT352_22605 [Streptosporangium sp. NPDC000563]|uniref:hypothetical protein n=1 Tax=Streptosporangium sp. NPDC000563 TaxID=3154366 RepID=UPI003319DAF6